MLTFDPDLAPITFDAVTVSPNPPEIKETSVKTLESAETAS